MRKHGEGIIMSRGSVYGVRLDGASDTGYWGVCYGRSSISGARQDKALNSTLGVLATVAPG